jgi:DeoR/GlpR family transcriptional regulator of sugar metabolism
VPQVSSAAADETWDRPMHQKQIRAVKFGRRSLSRIVPPSAIHCAVTDKALPRPTERRIAR